MNTNRTSIALVLAAAAFVAWGAVLFFGSSILSAEDARAAERQDAQQTFVANSSSVRTHAIVVDTLPERTRLDQLLTIDVVSAANLLKGLGKTTGVALQLSGALHETSPVAPFRGPQIQAVGFAVQADGSFAALMRTAALVETLPLASSVERFDIQHSESGGGAKNAGLWHMSIYIRVLTTSNISS